MMALAGVDLSWIEAAPCRGLDPDLFFAEGRGDEYSTARSVCRGCPFSGLDGPCIDYAARVLDAMSWAHFGMFGGFTPGDRKGRALRALRHARQAPQEVPEGCGTEAGYHRHRSHREEACEACRVAHADYERERQRRAEAMRPRSRSKLPGVSERYGAATITAKARAVDA